MAPAGPHPAMQQLTSLVPTSPVRPLLPSIVAATGRVKGLTPVPGYRVTLGARGTVLEVGMSEASAVIYGPAPAFEGPVVCTLPLGHVGGRLRDFRDGVFRHLRAMERPGPTRLRLVLAEEAGVEEVRELLVREQRCCGFLAFAIRHQEGRVLVDLEVREAAAAALDGLAQLAALAAPEAAR
jgi:hypothetical protein